MFIGRKVTRTSTSLIKEYRRLQAWNLHQKGWLGRDIAEALGVTKAAVSQWLRCARQHGSEALHAALRSGTPRLRPEQKARLPELLVRGAEA